MALKKLSTALLTFCVFFTASIGMADITDNGLRTCIEDTLEVAHGSTLSTAQLESITQLSCYQDSAVADLSGIGALANLERLVLTHGSISDLSPLSSLPALDYLSLEYNNIADITPLASMTSLTKLRLGHNQIIDISPLANLTSLICLVLSYNQIENILPLSAMTSLNYLDIQGNYIYTLQPLSQLSSLSSLWLRSNCILDYSPVSHVETIGGDDEQRSDCSYIVDGTLPVGANSYPLYAAINDPLILPGGAYGWKPIALGDPSTGWLNLRVATPEFDSPVDMYLGVQIPNTSISDLLLIEDLPGNSYATKSLQDGFIPWQANVSQAIESRYVFEGNTDMSILPVGTYVLYFMITPAGACQGQVTVGCLDNYYLWATSFTNP